MKKKGFSLFAVPRSGSTPIGQLLGQYLFQNEQIPYLSEVFNLKYSLHANPKIEVDPWFFIPPNNQEMDRIWQVNPKYLLDEIDRRYNAIISLKKTYSIKITLPHPGVERLLDLRNVFDPIFLFKKDKWDHFLGYLLAFTLDHFYEDQPLVAGREKVVVANRALAENFAKGLKELLDLYNRIEEPKLIFYEDFVACGPSAILQNMGWNQGYDLSKVDLKKRQIHGSKEKLIENIEEVRTWYNQLKIDEVELPG